MRILAVDYGDARTGLALCDSRETLASPLGVIREKNIERVVAHIAAAVQQHGAGCVVVGLPVNMNGTEGPRAEKCRRVAARIGEALPGIPVELYDERQTTQSAMVYMNATDTRGKKRKAQLDEAAAAIILEGFLAYRRNTGLRLEETGPTDGGAGGGQTE